MFAFIKGVLYASSPLSIVLETYGIGYKIFIPSHFFAKLPQVGESLLVHTSHVVRELSHTLYGFSSAQERDVFEILMGVSGIGPKLALSIVGHVEMHALNRAIQNEEITFICKIPGIGKKTAQRLVIELRDKLSHLIFDNPTELPTMSAPSPHTLKIRDAVSALINLGYNHQVATQAIKETLKNSSEEIDLASLIRSSLQNCMK